jgi:hypothetical protein
VDTRLFAMAALLAVPAAARAADSVVAVSLPAHVSAGGTLTGTVTVANAGLRTAPATKVAIRVGHRAVGSLRVPSLTAGRLLALTLSSRLPRTVRHGHAVFSFCLGRCLTHRVSVTAPLPDLQFRGRRGKSQPALVQLW